MESVDYSKDTVKVRYEHNVAVGVGDYTRHATGDCDYRETGEMRVMVTIYLAEITRSNVKNIIQHYTDDWPPADEDYLLTRSDIHWTSDGLTKLPVDLFGLNRNKLYFLDRRSRRSVASPVQRRGGC